MWLKRDLSLIGRNIILKSLAISKLVFLFSVLPNPQDYFFSRLKKIITKFLCYNKPAKIQYSVLVNGVESLTRTEYANMRTAADQVPYKR